MPSLNRKKVGTSALACAAQMGLDVLSDPKNTQILMCFILVAELVFNIFIIRRIKYTEIDWSTYMQQVEVYRSGNYNYAEIKGDTGPCVYPGLHLYIYSILYQITNQGKNILRAQWIFMWFYLYNSFIVLSIYKNINKLQPWTLIPMFLLSKRIHSIFVLRLFNDPISMMFMYTSIYLLTCQSCSHKNLRYILSTVCFTLALNIKMNILLFAPGFAVVYFFNLGLIHSILHAILITGCGTILINLPFLLYHPENFIKAAFDFGRKFLYEWTVNWRFLDEATFLNESFHQILLALHLVVVTVFIYRVFMKIYSQKDNRNLTNSQIVLLLFTSNLIGITFSRSLHYQFLSWYHHSLPALVFLAENFKTRTCLLILGLIEFCWNVFPSTEFSSSMLFGCHLIILAAIFRKLDSLFDNLTVSSKKTE